MDDRITVSELKQVLGGDIEQLYRDVVEVVNRARPGQIITDSEEPVREAIGEFRKRLYQKALELRQQKSEPAFSPSQDTAEAELAQQRQTENQLSDGERQN
jgi:hypothetical protein